MYKRKFDGIIENMRGEGFNILEFEHVTKWPV